MTDSPRSELEGFEAGGSAPGVGRQGRLRHLVVARVCEQGGFGLASLLLARRLGVESYAPVALLFVLNSLAIMLSDFGLGMGVMRAQTGQVNFLMLRRVRLANVVIAVGGAVLAVALAGDSRSVTGCFVLIWGLSAEAFVRKAALLRLGHLQRVALIEVAGVAIFAAIIGLALLHPELAVVLTGAAFIAKHVAESLLCRRWRAVFGTGATSTPILSVWLTQCLAYGCANIDYLLVGVLISSAAFSVYSLAFRIAALMTSQVTYAVQRVMLVDFGEGAGDDERQRHYAQRSRQLFLIGLTAALATIVVAPLFRLFLGSSWQGVAMVVVVLAVAIPWRMVLGVSGTLAIGAGHSPHLIRWETGRLVITASALAAAALIGFPAFVATSAIVAVVTTDALHGLAARRARIAVWQPMLWASALAIPIAAACAFFVTTPR